MTVIYKIQAADGTFSKGGGSPRFSKSGKTWARASDVSSHLAQLDDYGHAIYRRAQAQIVEFEVEPVEHHAIQDWMIGIVERRDKRNKAAQVREDRQQRMELAQSIEQKQQELAYLIAREKRIIHGT